MKHSYVYLNPIAVIKVEVPLDLSDEAKINEAIDRVDISGLDLKSRLVSPFVEYAEVGDESDGYLVVVDNDKGEVSSQWYEADGETPMPPSSLHRVHLTARELALVRSGLQLLYKIPGANELLNRLPEDTDGKS